MLDKKYVNAKMTEETKRIDLKISKLEEEIKKNKEKVFSIKKDYDNIGINNNQDIIKKYECLLEECQKLEKLKKEKLKWECFKRYSEKVISRNKDGQNTSDYDNIHMSEIDSGTPDIHDSGFSGIEELIKDLYITKIFENHIRNNVK
jgi:Zn-dependent M32 family carboxypeptidase